jgi:hypothetical protein
MSYMKRFAEQVSEEMGLDGEITDAVLVEAQKRLDAGEWASHAATLADAVVRMANRADTVGGYRTRKGKPGPTTRKEFDRDWMPLLDALRAHFRGERTIGLHSTTPGNVCRWIAFDIDAHNGEDASENHAKALEVARRLEERGLEPYIFDSNGKGGFHVWAILHDPSSSQHAYKLAREIADGLHIEAFPKQPEIRPGGFGNWIRLPGLHHKGRHWSRLWTEHGWATAKETVEAVIAMARSAVTCQNLTTC